MNNTIEVIERRAEELERENFLFLNGYNVQRIVYELIKNYMQANTPQECGVTLAQKYDPDVTKSSIALDISYNWKAQVMDKVPAVYVQRGDISTSSPVIGQTIAYNIQESENTKITINSMPVIITCVAAQPIAVVENLAEYVRQPLSYFRDEIRDDFKFRRFRLEKISSPALVQEGKNNFFINLVLETVFDENWIVKRDDLKLKSCSMIFDSIVKNNTCCPL